MLSHQSHTPSNVKATEAWCHTPQTLCTMLFTFQGEALEFSVHQSAQSPRSTSASCRRGYKCIVKMESIFQSYLKFYRWLVGFFYHIQGLIFHYPKCLVGLWKHLYQVKYNLVIKYDERIWLPQNVWLGYETHVSNLLHMRSSTLFKSLSSSQLGQTKSESTPGLSKGKTRMG